jgi:hypothetical protein
MVALWTVVLIYSVVTGLCYKLALGEDWLILPRTSRGGMFKIAHLIKIAD